MMSDLTTMPDTRIHWKAQIHRLAYENGFITAKQAKAFGSTIEGCLDGSVQGFLKRRRWFRMTPSKHYVPINVWHDTRANPTITRKHRKDDLEYTIVSILQNCGPLASPKILENMWLNNARQPSLCLITNCCNLSTHILGSAETQWRVET
jgi:hypothetical protein